MRLDQWLFTETEQSKNVFGQVPPNTSMVQLTLHLALDFHIPSLNVLTGLGC